MTPAATRATASPAATTACRCGCVRSTTTRGLALCADDDGARHDRRDRARRARRARRRAARARGRRALAWERRMKFVDEFRDAELGRVLAGEILAARRARPPLQGDGGLRRPHALDLQVRRRRPAAGERRARARARLPGVRDPDGPRRRRHRRRPRAGRDLHLLRRHDARARLATARCSRPRPRAPTCGWSTRRSTRCGSPRPNPDREVVFFAIGFETTAPSTALTLKRAKAEGVANFSCMCSHVTIVPPLRALLDSPDLRLDGFIGPGHVSTVVGARPFEFIPRRLRQAGRDRGLRAARHPAGDPDDPRAARARAAARSRTSTSASSRTRATPRALEVMAEVFELRPHFEWRGLGFISH